MDGVNLAWMVVLMVLGPEGLVTVGKEGRRERRSAARRSPGMMR